MNKPLPAALIGWLNRPTWQLLATQWMLLAGIAVFVSVLWGRDEWQQNTQLQAKQQQNTHDIHQLQQQLRQLPALDELEAQLVPRSEEPVDTALAESLRQAGGRLLRLRQQGQPPQQQLKMQMKYGDLLRLLADLSPGLRITQLNLETQVAGLIVELVLQAEDGDDQAK
ncbi:hypothetical protein ACQKDS_12940 [Serratia sp. NPDC078593]|uniref:hypothetical protein n=1 Tax=unclassified Serratia (in: enterobacteria) TaxID=2647522 RepID=UPI0037D8DE07